MVVAHTLHAGELAIGTGGRSTELEAFTRVDGCFVSILLSVVRH